MQTEKFIPAKTTLADYTKYTAAKDLASMSLAEIAWIIRKDWRLTSKNGVNYAAKPYLEAMMLMDSVNSNFGLDTGKEIVIRFLTNAGTWKGDTAKAIKAHLKTLVGL